MTNEELIAWLRDLAVVLGKEAFTCAADRIELLATTNEQLVATNEDLSISNATLIAERDALFRRATLAEEWRDHDKTRAEEAEAKLAENEVRLRKAVKALEGVMSHMPDYADTAWQDARATLAEIKSHSDEFATQKGETK